jgi:hypothetical protein
LAEKEPKMRTGERKAFRAIAALLVFSFTQVSLQVGFAAGSSTSVLPIPQQLILAKVERVRGTALSVNGNSAATGATITTASTIETGPDTAVTINLGPLGNLDLAPNTRLELTYDENKVKVKLIQGCVILRTKNKKDGEVTTQNDDSAGKTPAGGGLLDICIPGGGGNPIVNQGAAAAAGAGTAGAVAAGATSAGLFGLGVPGTIALFGGIATAIIVPVTLAQGNDSTSTP